MMVRDGLIFLGSATFCRNLLSLFSCLTFLSNLRLLNPLAMNSRGVLFRISSSIYMRFHIRRECSYLQAIACREVRSYP
jgi:hypothetical protein